MVKTLTIKKIATNIAIGREIMEIEVIDILFSELVIKKFAKVLSGLFLKCMIAI